MISSLLMIVEVTLFFGDLDLDMGIGLSLTVMLVMYTMYQSINESIPKTAYLKFIDIWIGCCLFIPFIVFFIQIGWKLFRPAVPSTRKKTEVLEENKKFISNDLETTADVDNNCPRVQSRVKSLLKWFVPTLTLAFILGYSFSAMCLYDLH
jgi:hypothetical protein